MAKARELSRIQWEMLFSADQNSYICLSDRDQTGVIGELVELGLITAGAAIDKVNGGPYIGTLYKITDGGRELVALSRQTRH